MATKYRGGASEVRALDVYIKLMRCARSVASRLEGQLRVAKLTENQFGVLETLLHLGVLEQHELGAKLFTSRPNITLVIDQLEKRSLVCRERCAEDRRCVRVSLTPEGSRFIKELFPRYLETIIEEFSVLNARELEELARLTKKLGRRG